MCQGCLQVGPGVRSPAVNCREPEIPMSNEVKYMLNRVNIVQESFPSATSMDDFIFKLEMALVAYGFTGDNSIGGFCCGHCCCERLSSEGRLFKRPLS